MLEKNAALLVLLAACVRLASSVHCYDCSSVNNSMCLDPTLYDKETLVKFLPASPCGNGVYSSEQHGFFCRKIVQTIFHKGYEPEVRVTRGCGWIRHQRDCYKADNEDHLETVCQCFSDGCNGAALLGASGVAIMLAMAVLGAFGNTII